MTRRAHKHKQYITSSDAIAQRKTLAALQLHCSRSGVDNDRSEKRLSLTAFTYSKCQDLMKTILHSCTQC
jgi:hypothetical protein